MGSAVNAEVTRGSSESSTRRSHTCEHEPVRRWSSLRSWSSRLVLAGCCLAGTLLLAGCFRPEPQAGARCAEGGRCPSPLACRDGLCVDENAPLVDAPLVDSLLVDARSDASIVDALDVVGCADGAREAFTISKRFRASPVAPRVGTARSIFAHNRPANSAATIYNSAHHRPTHAPQDGDCAVSTVNQWI